MRIFVFVFLLLGVTGCMESNWQSVDDFLLNENIVQEQKNSSILSSSNSRLTQAGESSGWADENYPKRCVWYDFERAVDGDTIIVREGAKRIRVRMIGIDTPESKKEGTVIEPYSIESGEKLKNLLGGEAKVCLIEDKVGDKYDIYGRKLSYVFREDGMDLNAEMVKVGLAKAYTRFPFERKDVFVEFEKAARNQKVGRWE